MVRGTTGAVVEVFADIWCPFTHVGLRGFEDLRVRTGRSDVGIRVRAWPLELVNGAPADPDVTLQHVRDLQREVAPSLFRNLDVHRFPGSTLPALALVNRAYRTEFEVGERASFALRDALFEEGRDISDPAVLGRVAGDLGVVGPDESDHAAVIADWHEGQQRGVLGSPHFFCGESNIFCPSLDITENPGRGASIVTDTSRLTEFLNQCFAGRSA